MRIFGIVGWSGAGKTTLIEALLPVLTGRGLTVSTMKHTHDAVDLDRPGKDTHRHRLAGAAEVMLVSGAGRWTLMHELPGHAVPRPEDLLARMTPVDLVLIEGFKAGGYRKLEVYRQAIGRPPLAAQDGGIIAVVGDAPLAGVAVPVLALDNAPAIADLIIEHASAAG